MKIAKWIYSKALPIYIKISKKIKLAAWCCIDIKKSSNLMEVLKGIRITIRKDANSIFVIKQGEV